MKMKEMIPSLKAYAFVRQQCDDEFQKNKKYLEANYNQNTALYQQMLDKVKQDIDAKVQDAMDKTVAKVDKAIADTNQAMDDYVVAPLSQEQHTILGVLDKLKDGMISDAEAELYYRQLLPNYSAKRMGYPMLTKATGKQYLFIPYDGIKETVDRMENKVKAWVCNYNPVSYDHFDFMATFEQDLINADAEVEAFLGGKA